MLNSHAQYGNWNFKVSNQCVHVSDVELPRAVWELKQKLVRTMNGKIFCWTPTRSMGIETAKLLKPLILLAGWTPTRSMGIETNERHCWGCHMARWTPTCSMGIETSLWYKHHLLANSWTPTRSMGIETMSASMDLISLAMLNSHAQYGNWNFASEEYSFANVVPDKGFGPSFFLF